MQRPTVVNKLTIFQKRRMLFCTFEITVVVPILYLLIGTQIAGFLHLCGLAESSIAFAPLMFLILGTFNAILVGCAEKVCKFLMRVKNEKIEN